MDLAVGRRPSQRPCLGAEQIGAGQQLVLGGELSATATHTGTAVSTAGGEAAGTETAVGACFALTVADDLTLATTERDIDAAGAVTFAAHGAGSSAADPARAACTSRCGGRSGLCHRSRALAWAKR